MSDTHQTLADQAFDALNAALHNGDLRAGSFFSMPELARKLGYPIAAIREATKLAEARSLLHILPKRGITVMDAGPEVTFNCMDMRAALEKEGAQRILGRGIAFPAAKLRASHETFLKRAQSAGSDATGSEAIQIDLSLHDALSEGLTNPFLRQCYQENRDRIAVIQNSRPFLQERIISAMEEHLEIIAAMETGDLTRVLSGIDYHLAQTLRWWGVSTAPGLPATSPPK